MYVATLLVKTETSRTSPALAQVMLRHRSYTLSSDLNAIFLHRVHTMSKHGNYTPTLATGRSQANSLTLAETPRQISTWQRTSDQHQLDIDPTRKCRIDV